MDLLLQTVSQTVVHDVRALVHASQLLDAPALDELEPPGFQWHWHLPLGFVSLAAAGALLIAAGGVHWQVQEQRHSARRVHPKMHTKMHTKKLQVVASSARRH
jgi:hypothetical protein